MKKVGRILIVFLFIFLCSGCVKYNADMKINKDKSMNFSITYAVNSSLLSEESLFDKEELNKLKKKGYTVTEYNKDNMKGFVITQNYKNIDEISSEKNTNYSLSNLFDEKSDSKYIFKVKKGLFKNHYYADFKFSSSDSGLNNDTTTNDTALEEETTSEDSSYESDSSSETEDADYSSLLENSSSMDLSFNVSLPYSSVKNNASNSNNNNKELKWNLTTANNQNIKFEFELYNMTNIYIFAGIACGILILVVGLVVFVIVKKSKK